SLARLGSPNETSPQDACSGAVVHPACRLYASASDAEKRFRNRHLTSNVQCVIFAFVTSEAKIAANRRNALKSTGPKTERGRERARLNALRHGMTAKHLVADDEDFGDFARFNAELRATLAPADAVEEQLVDGIVVSTWRLRRAWRTEAAV